MLTRQELVDTLRILHEHASIGNILDALATLCQIRASQEEEAGNAEGAALYIRAVQEIDGIDHVYV